MKLISPSFRVSFPSVFAPSSGFDGQEEKYSVVMLFDKNTNLDAMKEAVAQCAAEKWGNKIPKDLRSPFRDGDEKDLDGYKGTTYVKASSKTRPGLVDKDLQPILSQEEFYPGCYARASLSVFAYDRTGNKGVSFGLMNIQKLDEGESFSGKSKPEDDFKA